MTTLLEDPLPIIFFGVIAEAILGAALVSTRRGVLLAAMAGVLVIVLAGLGLERWVVTQRERVETTLDGVVAALESNDVNEVLQYVAPDAVYTRGRAYFAMSLIEITDAKIHSLQITINELTSPPTAEASFNGVVYYRDRTGQIPYEYYSSPFTVEFRKEGDRWLITNHVERDRRGLGSPADRADR
jgi:ketosteroid isomerase-like protein